MPEGVQTKDGFIEHDRADERFPILVLIGAAERWVIRPSMWIRLGILETVDHRLQFVEGEAESRHPGIDLHVHGEAEARLRPCCRRCEGFGPARAVDTTGVRLKDSMN